MKKLLALSLFLLILFPVLPVGGVNPLVFTAINDVLQLNPTPSSVPVKIGNTVYVVPETFTRVLELKTIYNQTLNQYLIYNSEVHLVFDLQNNMTFDESGRVYPTVATKVGGKIYLPVALVCQKFGFKYSYATLSSLGSVVRINTEDAASDDLFIERNVELMRSIYLTYSKTYNSDSTNPPPPIVPEDPVIDEETNVPPEVLAGRTSLLFEVSDVQGASDILKTLRDANIHAAFFFSQPFALEGDFVRQVYIDGHSIGISLPAGGKAAEADQVNHILKGQILTKTPLVLIQGAYSPEQVSAFSQGGYRLWSGTYRAAGSTRRIVSDTKKHLKNRTASSRLIFSTGSAEAKAIGQLVPYLQDNSYTIFPVLPTDKPK